MGPTMIFMPFWDLLKTTLASHMTIQVLHMLGKAIDRNQLFSHEERSAMIKFWLKCDSEYQMQSALNKAAEHLKAQFTTGMAQLETTFKYSKIDEGLYLVGRALQALLKADPVSRDHHRAQFIRAFAKYDPRDLLTLLHRDVTVNDTVGNFLPTLMKSCDYNYHSYEQWCDHIALNALRGYFCCLHQLYEEHALDLGALVLPHTVQMEVDLMVEEVEGILKALQESKNHCRKHMFTVTEDGQSELNSMVDTFMVHCQEEPMRNNQHCAEKFGKELSRKYPWFAWAVIIAEESYNKSNFVTYSDDFRDDFFIQQSIHFQIVPYLVSTATSRPAHTVLLNGEKVGMIICTKRVHVLRNAASTRNLIVMWTNHGEMLTLRQDAKQLLANVDVKQLIPEDRNHCIREQKTAWEVQQSPLEDILFRDGLQYVACVGVCGKRKKNEVGVYVTENEDGSCWPYRMENKTGQLFLWTNKATTRALEFRTRRPHLSISSLVDAVHPITQLLMVVDASDGTPENEFKQDVDSKADTIAKETRERDNLLVLCSDVAALGDGNMSEADTGSHDTVRSRIEFFERRPNTAGYSFTKK